MKQALLASAAALIVVATSPAQAAAVINNDGSVTFNTAPGSNTASINFTGQADDVPVAGLSAILTLTLQTIVGGTYNFLYSLTNTSTVANARVSGFGFDTNPNVTSATATGAFDETNITGSNFPSLDQNIEVCVNAGPGNCPNSNPDGSAGVPTDGSVFAGTPGSGSLSLTFAGSPTSITLSNFADRYQGFTTTNANGQTVTSAVGVGTPSGVPEPGTWALMLVGFGFLGMAMRRRKDTNVTGRIRFA